MEKVFCIGLNKTGTLSLHEALGILGYRSLHWGGPETRELVLRAMAEDQPLLTHLDPSYDAFSDIEDLTYNFDALDVQYPGSRFILTVRDVGEWIESRRRHVARNRVRQAEGTYHGRFLHVDEAAWVADYERHVARVRAHFAGRDDLLELDVTTGGGWAPLCRFLGHEVPSVPFPWVNKARSLGASGT